MQSNHTLHAAALGAALFMLAMTPAWAGDTGDNTNSKSNAQVQRSEGLPTQSATTRTATGERDVDMSGWANDYATRNHGRISRRAYMDEMGRRWDEVDSNGQGLTPADVSRLTGRVDSSAPPPLSGSGVQAGNMGPGNSKGK